MLRKVNRVSDELVRISCRRRAQIIAIFQEADRQLDLLPMTRLRKAGGGQRSRGHLILMSYTPVAN